MRISSNAKNLELLVDENSGAKGFVLSPKELTIAHGDDETYWEWDWILVESQGCLIMEAPKLVQSCPLEIKGKFDISELTPEIKYEVAFMAMLKNPEGWEAPVSLRLDSPDDSAKSHDVVFSDLPANQWVMLVTGDFTASGAGEINFSMLETSTENKKGLIVKDVIRPVYYERKMVFLVEM